MSAQKYLLSIMSMNELFKVQDACNMLKRFSLSDPFLEQDVNAEVEKRVKEPVGWKI
jgi:hypothetical protein